MFGISTKMKRRSDAELRINEQAATVAAAHSASRSKPPPDATVVDQSDADVPCRRRSLVQAGAQWDGPAQELRPGGHPNSRPRDRRQATQRRARARTGHQILGACRVSGPHRRQRDGSAGQGPDDRQMLMLFLPIDVDSGRVAQAIAQQRAARVNAYRAIPTPSTSARTRQASASSPRWARSRSEHPVGGRVSASARTRTSGSARVPTSRSAASVLRI